MSSPKKRLTPKSPQKPKAPDSEEPQQPKAPDSEQPQKPTAPHSGEPQRPAAPDSEEPQQPKAPTFEEPRVPDTLETELGALEAMMGRTLKPQTEEGSEEREAADSGPDGGPPATEPDV